MVIFIILSIIGCNSNIKLYDFKSENYLTRIVNIKLEKDVLNKIDELQLYKDEIQTKLLLKYLIKIKFFNAVELILEKNSKVSIEDTMDSYELFDEEINLQLDDDHIEYLLIKNFNISEILFKSLYRYCKLINNLKGSPCEEKVSIRIDALDDSLINIVRFLLNKGANKDYEDKEGNNFLSKIVTMHPFMGYKIHQKERTILEKRHLLLFNRLSELVTHLTGESFDFKFVNVKNKKDILSMSINSIELLKFILDKYNIFLYKLKDLSKGLEPMKYNNLRITFFERLAKKYNKETCDSIDIFLAPNRLNSKTTVDNCCKKSYINMKNSILISIVRILKTNGYNLKSSYDIETRDIYNIFNFLSNNEDILNYLSTHF